MADQTSTIPKDWKMTTLGEVINIQPGFAFKSQDFETKYVFHLLFTDDLQN